MQDRYVNNPAQSVEYVTETDVAFSEVCVVHIDLPDVIHVIPLVHDSGYRFFIILLDLYDVIFATNVDKHTRVQIHVRHLAVQGGMPLESNLAS